MSLLRVTTILALLAAIIAMAVADHYQPDRAPDFRDRVLTRVK